MSRKKKSFISIVWNKVVSFFQIVWKMLCDLGRGLLKIIHVVLDFCIKSSRFFFYVLFGTIISVSIFLIAAGIFIYLISQSVDLAESDAFKLKRDVFLQKSHHYEHREKWAHDCDFRKKGLKKGTGGVVLNQEMELEI